MIKKIEIPSQNEILKGQLYLPEGDSESLPTVVITGAWTTVKEQMATTYAKALNQKGYAAVVFDFIGWGESTGGIPFYEDPDTKIQNIKDVFAHISSYPEVDGSRLAGLGICASAGYMVAASINNPNVKSTALVAAWLHDAEIVEAAYGGPEAVAALMEVGSNSAKSTNPVIIEAASMTNENALMYQAPYYTEANRGLIPEYDNKFNVASWIGWLTFNAQKYAASYDKPLCIIHSEAAAIPAGVHKFKQANDRVETIWLENITQFDFYDIEEVVEKATKLVVNHLSKTL